MGCTCFKGVVLGGGVWGFAHFKVCNLQQLTFLLSSFHHSSMANAPLALWEKVLSQLLGGKPWPSSWTKPYSKTLLDVIYWNQFECHKKNLKDIIISEISSKDGRIISIQHPWESSIFEIFEVATSSNLPRKLRRGAACHIFCKENLSLKKSTKQKTQPLLSSGRQHRTRSHPHGDCMAASFPACPPGSSGQFITNFLRGPNVESSESKPSFPYMHCSREASSHMVKSKALMLQHSSN